MRELMDGIEVIRVAHYPSHDRSGIRRFIYYFSFALTASSIGLFSVRRPDVIHVCQGAPTLMMLAILIKILYRVPIVLDIQDLWPESVISSGMFKVPGGLWMLHLWCRMIPQFTHPSRQCF
jgi:colanic acid biosynthesis glycosyl transferase WcaI